MPGTRNKEYVFSTPKTITITRTARVDRVEECNMLVHEGINSLPCALCVRPIGDTRPIGIARGTLANDEHIYGFRLCNACYSLCREEL